MSKLNDHKTSVINSICAKNCCGYAFLLAVFKSGIATITAKQAVLKDLGKEFFDLLISVLKTFYGDSIEVKKMNGKIEIGGIKFINMLIECSILQPDGKSFEFTCGIDEKLLSDNCCKITFLQTLFVCIGHFYFVQQGNQKSKGYNLEFAFKDIAVTDDVNALLTSFNLTFKQHKKFNNLILYSKDSENIFNFFVHIGAVELSLIVQNNLAVRDIRNEINRQNNCYEANLNKTINSSIEQIKAINFLLDSGNFDNLDFGLKDIALLRIANPEATLQELQQLSEGPITRAGIKYKLDKIYRIYKSLEG